MASRKNKVDAQNSVKKVRGDPDKWFKPNNPWRFPKGKSGNPGGRPKLLSDAYREWLASADESGVSNAAKLAAKLGDKATSQADVSAAKELRQATEGDLIRDLSKMTDAELDDFIAQRERGAIPGAPGAGPTSGQATGQPPAT